VYVFAQPINVIFDTSRRYL